jgi:LacI family asc operon transcriptional repressor
MDEIVEKCEQPIMVLNRRLRKNSSHCVWSDHKASCQDAVSQLIAKGHREIAFITGSLDSPPGLSVFPATKTRWRSTVFRCARS